MSISGSAATQNAYKRVLNPKPLVVSEVVALVATTIGGVLTSLYGFLGAVLDAAGATDTGAVTIVGLVLAFSVAAYLWRKGKK